MFKVGSPAGAVRQDRDAVALLMRGTAGGIDADGSDRARQHHMFNIVGREGVGKFRVGKGVKAVFARNRMDSIAV